MTEAGTSKTSSANWRLVLLLTAVASSGYVGRVAVTVAASGMMNCFNLSQAQMGTASMRDTSFLCCASDGRCSILSPHS
jgi:hypothetical protein